MKRIIILLILCMLVFVGCTKVREEPIVGKDCAGVGEVGPNPSLGPDDEGLECCEGLVGVSSCGLKEGETCEEYFTLAGCGSTCSECGNGICEEWEHRCSCPEDCKAECAKEGEQFSEIYSDEYPENCCEGLTEWESGFDTRISVEDECYGTGLASGYPVGTCINCGNEVCEDIETPCNCPEDCVGEGKSEFATVAEFCDTGFEHYCKYPDEAEELCNLCNFEGVIVD